jgi:hypothetical protein
MDGLEARAMTKHPVLPEPDLSRHQMVAEERTNIVAMVSKQYVVRTVFLLGVFVLSCGIVSGTRPTDTCGSPKAAAAVQASSSS